MPPTPTPLDREPGRAGAVGRSASALLVVLAAGAIGPAIGVAQAQAPGLETFARPPQTPLELWDAIGYLTRVGLTDQAVPLIDRFLQLEPDDATLLEIRDRFGLGSILRLQDDPRTAGRVREILDRLAAASRRNARREDRLRRAVELLVGSPVQQGEALLRLDEAGPYAVPYLIEALADRPVGSPERALLVGNMGRLDRRAVPALLAALDAPDPTLAADAASVLARIGDRRALPFLVSLASTAGDDPAPARTQALDAIRRIAGAPMGELSRTPARLLLDEARRYLTGAYQFPGDQVELWTWQDGNVSPVLVRPDEAEVRLGSRFADRALELDPGDPEARAVRLALQIRAQQVGPAPEPGTAPLDLSREDPEILAEALRLVQESKQFDLAPPLISALGRVADPSSLEAADPPSPLVSALAVPDRRVQLAAASEIARLDPAVGIPGASRVVPILARSLLPGDLPEVVVVSGNTPLLTTIASSLRERGIAPITASTADEGFARAAESAGVEALIVDPAFLRGGRDARDLILDLRSDARTAGLPVLLPLPIDPARAIARGREYAIRQSEVEPNDIPVRATPITFVGVPRKGRIDGRLSVDDRPPYNQPKRELPDPNAPPAVDRPVDPLSPPPLPAEGEEAGEETPPVDISGDLFEIGPLRPGDSISAIIEPAPGSTLRPVDVALWLERREGPGGVPVATGLGSLALTIDTPGVYDLRAQGAERFLYGNRALYRLEVTVYDSVRPTPPIPGTARVRVEALAREFDRVAVLTAPGDPSAVEEALARSWGRIGDVPIPRAELEAMADAAADALAGIASRPGGSFAADLARVVPQLQRALAEPSRAPAAAAALAAVPTVEAQRSLADFAADTTRPAPSRVAAAQALQTSISRFGSLLAKDQRPRLLRARDRAAEPGLREALDAVAGDLTTRAPAADDPGPNPVE
ncbi:HEAT repeat domain-containing protein [Tautonia plasticadhaerens]|uniref:HEAT repeat protein n=1 Tax=Tautonia plasticadhaerens TaxID=2527974 RepID=A0A518H746_9BACT|nr:HEAT repeat domain-containing protein [Tautonia plasticadhaerens]QDV36624.1 hypothetical protein ElP_45520 [Tautonia plasticadhaerens]